MRVVAGSARGNRLLTVPGEGTRPILDRVKTALFDILRPRIAGCAMLDLFAGSGSVGIEALSQGAASCTFIDRGGPAVATIRKNLASTGLAGRATVRPGDSFAFLRTTPASFDLIYVAPPQYRGLWADALRLIAARPELLRESAPSGSDDDNARDGLVVVQIDPKEYKGLGDLGTLIETRQARYGNTLLLFYESPGGRSLSGGPSTAQPT